MRATPPLRRVLLLAAAGSCALLLIHGPAPAAAQISVSPALPTTRDAISLVAPGCIYQSPPTISGNTITLTGFTIPPPCSAPLWLPVQAFFPLPRLAAGSYTVHATAEGTTSTTVFQVIEPASTLYLLHGRFAVTVSFALPGPGAPAPGAASTVQLSDESGYFWFVDSANVELVVKILDGEPVNGHFWVFIASLTDLPCTVKVVDQAAALSRVCRVPGQTADDCSRSYVSTGGTNRNFIDLGSF